MKADGPAAAGGRQSIEDEQQEMVLRFSTMKDWLDRYNYLIELSRSLPPMDERHKTQRNALPGCESQAFVYSQVVDGRVFFQAYSDSRLVRGILALLLEVVDGRPVEEVAAANLHFVETIGLDRELSPSRAKGLKLLVGRIRSFEAEG